MTTIGRMMARLIMAGYAPAILAPILIVAFVH
jgi:hypothetical protein